MQQVTKKLKISEFFSIATQLVFESAKIMRDIETTQSMDVKMKGIDDPMTIADIKAQTVLIKGFRQFWPSIRIVGEEDTIYEKELGFDFSTLNPNLFNESLFSKSIDNTLIRSEIDLNDDVCIWIDPLDGTLSYVSKDFDGVTTLVGLSVGKRPLLGVIGRPYIQSNDQCVFQPMIYFGNSEQKKIYYAYGHDVQKRNEIIPYELVRPKLVNKKNFSICSQKLRMKKSVEQLIMALNPENLIGIGGSGRKCLSVLLGETDVYIYVGQKTKKWDTCAGEALLNCFGGQLFGLGGQIYDYHADSQQIDNLELYANEFGLIGSLYSKEQLSNLINQSKSFL